MQTSWYVVKVFPGKERQLSEQFNTQISLGRLKNVIRFVCPTEKEYVTVKNKKILREKVIYNGYIYFEAETKLNEEDLKNISSFQSIMGMMGDKKPILMNSFDVKKILKDESLEEHIEIKKQRFKIKEKVMVNEGPFRTFTAEVTKTYDDKVDVEVFIFGRGNTITLSYDQISKIS